jgi:thiol-disulfide isomerase/thioredoxin
MDKFNSSILYLEDSDFDKSGKLIRDLKKPLVVMIQKRACGFCQQAKPAYQEFANRINDAMVVGTIDADADKALINRIDKIVQIRDNQTCSRRVVGDI